MNTLTIFRRSALVPPSSIIPILTIAAISPLTAADLSDTFESYIVGEMPAGSWVDAADYIDNPSNPGSTASVINTTDAFGNATRAVQIDADYLGTSGGIAAGIETHRIQRFETDLRVDQQGNGSYPNWTYAAGFFTGTEQDDLINMPQAVIYSLNNSNQFRLYVKNADGPTGSNRDWVLGESEFELDTWYRMTLEVDTATGIFDVGIMDIESGESLIDTRRIYTGWNSDFGQYDLASINDGEYGSNVGTVGNQFTVDNINVTPAPGALGVLGLGLIGCARRNRSTP